MAVGRRKRLAAGTTSLTSVVVMYTAPAAPADGSAAATVTTLTVTVVGGSASNVTVYVPGSLVHWNQNAIPSGTTIPVPVPIDLMGGEVIAIQQSVAQRLDFSLSGVEAKDV
jgi:hypothetical protein